MEAFKSAVLQLLLWLVASGAVIALIIGRSHYGRRLETSIIHQQNVGAVDRVWFAGEDAVFATTRLQKGLGVIRIPPEPGTAADHRVVIDGGRDMPYAVSPEGDAIVSSKGTDVVVTPVVAGSAVHGHSSRRSEVTHLAWIEGNLVLALHSDGFLDAIDASSLEVRTVIDTELPSATALVGRRTYAAIASRDRRRIRLFDTRMIPQISVAEQQDLKEPFIALKLSTNGVIVIDAASNSAAAGGLPPGKTSSSSLVEILENGAAVFANASGLFLHDERFGTFQVPNVPAGITSVAALETRIAAGYANAVVVLSHRITPPIDIVGWTIIYRWLAMSAAVGMFCLARGAFIKANENRERAAKEELTDVVHTH